MGSWRACRCWTQVQKISFILTVLIIILMTSISQYNILISSLPRTATIQNAKFNCSLYPSSPRHCRNRHGQNLRLRNRQLFLLLQKRQHYFAAATRVSAYHQRSTLLMTRPRRQMKMRVRVWRQGKGVHRCLLVANESVRGGMRVGDEAAVVE